MAELLPIFERVGIALALGLLIGLQRERSESKTAGIRTCTLIAAFGTLCGLLATFYGGLMIAVGAATVAALLFVANLAKIHGEKPEPGLTTEAAVLVTFAVGAYVVNGYVEVAVALGGVTAVLLHFKQPLHALVNRMGEREVTAVMQLVLIAMVILPVLPDRTFGPFDVLNPREIWMMVSLIVGISVAGYIAYKWLGDRMGTVVGGVLGGLISSTATTVSYARRTKDSSHGASLAAVVIMIASTISVARVITEVVVVASNIVRSVVPPLAIFFCWMALISAAMYFVARRGDTKLPEPDSPAELKPALIFGALYALILLAVAATKHYFGNAGLYVVAVISGLTDVDAITLSTARLVSADRLGTTIGWKIMLIATLANVAFKGGVVAMLGSRRLMVIVGILFGAALAGGIAILLLWPMIESWIGLAQTEAGA